MLAKERATQFIHPRTVCPEQAGTRCSPPCQDFRSQRPAVNEYVIQKGLDKQLVFYWYQGRGRVIASEYLGKFWMVADAISRNRTDGALVRLVTPMNDDEAHARARLVSFTQLLFPHLENAIPN
jgi:EpsI family protein